MPQQAKQIQVPGEGSANAASATQSSSSPSQVGAARAQNHLGNAGVQERMGTSPATGGVAQGGGGVAAGSGAPGGGGETTSATAPHKKDHYKIEIKAWIPHDKVVDPEEPMRASDWLQTADDVLDAVSIGSVADPEYEFHSHYRGDAHSGYTGSYRVISIVEFDWDGTTITGFTASGDYGESHRDWDARAWIDTLLGDIPLGSWSGSEKDRATKATSGTPSGSNSFSMSIASANPLVMTWAPDINSDLTGTIGPDGSLSLSYSTDFFPSHGVQVSRNGKVVHTAITNDASSVNALGPVGAANLGARLMTQGNDGGAVLPGGGVSGTVPTK